MPSTSRNYQFDTIKAILIFLVVFGHFLELTHNSIGLWIYQIIYSFHMPAFIFCSGVFAKWSTRRLVHNLVYPYLVYQTLFLAFVSFIQQKTFLLQYKQPYWILWYIFSLILWTLLLPLLQKISCYKGAIALSVLISLASGFVDRIGYPFSLSRTLSMLPFFVAGYYTQQNLVAFAHTFKKLRASLLFVCSCIILCECGLLWMYRSQVKSTWLYGSYSYAKANYTPLIRGIILLFAASWIVWLLCVIPQKKVPVISYIGHYTLPIYLFHGFVVKAISVVPAWREFLDDTPVACFGIALLTCFLFGNSIVFRLFSFTFSSKWMSLLQTRVSCYFKTLISTNKS